MEGKMETTESTPEKAGAPVVAASAAAILLVLGDGDLLGEIFLRLAFATDLVRAAAVCKLWLRAASDPAFLRRFRDLHPPRLLGCYLGIAKLYRYWRVEFVPVPPQPTEPAASGNGDDDSTCTHIMDCRNGRIVIGLEHGEKFTMAMASPLHPSRGMVILPPLPMTSYDRGTSRRTMRFFGDILSREDGDGLAYFYFTLDYTYMDEEKGTACVYMLQDGAWHIHASATVHLPGLRGSLLYPRSAFLVDDKIYMGFTLHNIFVLDLTSSTFFTLKFPDRVVIDTNTVLSPANGSGIYLSHVNELQLCIWILKGGKDSVGDWSLVASICLRDMCSKLRMSNSTASDGYNGRVVSIPKVGDNGEFVFLQIYGCLVHLDVRSRAWQKVYELVDKNTEVYEICPFMTIWPPFFPMLEE